MAVTTATSKRVQIILISMPTLSLIQGGCPSIRPTNSRPVHSKFFPGQENFKIQDIFQDKKTCKHAEKVPLKSSKNGYPKPVLYLSVLFVRTVSSVPV